MGLLMDILASAAGVGPDFRTSHQAIRNLFRLGNGGYEATRCGILHVYHTLPFVDYGSTKEDDEITALLFNREGVPGASVFDQWYNAANPDGKKRRIDREGVRAYEGEGDQNNGPRILYNYYENGSWPGPRLAVLIVDELGASQQAYGADMSSVRYAFKAKLSEWDPAKEEYQRITLTHLYINGCYVSMGPKATEAANDYAGRLISMIFRDDGREYNPWQALKETLDKFGADVFQTSAWRARREIRDSLRYDNI